MKPVLFSNGCERCLLVKELMQDAGIPFEYVNVLTPEGLQWMRSTGDRLEVGFDSPAMPVMVQGDDLWTGEDCVIALVEEEIDLTSIHEWVC